MPSLQRMVYASRAAFAQSREGSGIEVEVARILMQSRRNNPRTGLVGALYFSDGCFFQCLEGEPSAIDALCERIAKDPRHREMKVLGRHPIEARSFPAWAMKFVPNAAAVQTLMARHGRKDFDPYTFDDTLVSDMVDLLRRGADVDLQQLDGQGRPRGGDRASSTPAPARARRHLGWLVVTALIAAALAMAALLIVR